MGYFSGQGRGEGNPGGWDLKEKIDRRLDAISQVFSTYIKDSEINRFNALSTAGEKFPVSPDFIQVMGIGRKIHQLSEGAWDGTVNPLVEQIVDLSHQRSFLTAPAAAAGTLGERVTRDPVRRP